MNGYAGTSRSTGGHARELPMETPRPHPRLSYPNPRTVKKSQARLSIMGNSARERRSPPRRTPLQRKREAPG
jgi:hypothetical protein